jgi:hypothetical protein
MATTSAQKQCGWFVVDGRPVASPKVLQAAVLQYRRQARRRLAEQIWIIEDELCRQLAGNLPLRARLTAHRGVNVFGRDDVESLREVIADTRPRAFTLRQRSGGEVVNRIAFWTYRTTACGIDELNDALGSPNDVFQDGKQTSFEAFVSQLQRLRGFRQAYCGMIKYGLEPHLLNAQSAEEFWLDCMVLPDDLETAVERMALIVEQLATPYGSEADRLHGRRCFDDLATGDDNVYVEMLSSSEAYFWELFGAAKSFGWRQLVALVSGFPDNWEDLVSDLPDAHLAPVISIRSKATPCRRAQVAATQ